MTCHSRKLLLPLLTAFALILSSACALAQTPQQTDQSQPDSSAAKKTAKQKTDTSSKGATTFASSTANGSASSTPASSASSSKTTTSGVSAKPQAPPANSSGMVWVNTDSGVYHKPGTRWYGKTKRGKYMLETDAIKAGYKAAK